MELREYHRGDEKGAFAVVKTVLAEFGLQTNPDQTDRDLSDIQKHYIDAGGSFKVIEDDGRIVGSYGLFSLSPETCELRKMYLLPEYQGRGLGRMMMKDAITSAKSRGFTEMVLETNTRLDKALRLYKKYGFREYEPEHLSDRCDCAMRLPL